MGDPRCKITGIWIEDLRCQSLVESVVQLEDQRCVGLDNRLVVEFGDPRGNRGPIRMEDPRCTSLLAKR